MCDRETTQQPLEDAPIFWDGARWIDTHGVVWFIFGPYPDSAIAAPSAIGVPQRLTPRGEG